MCLSFDTAPFLLHKFETFSAKGTIRVYNKLERRF